MIEVSSVSPQAFALSGWNGLSRVQSPVWRWILFCTLGPAFLTLSAQIQIGLPWTPVPITLQTFAVALLASFFGRKATVPVGIYLVGGFSGLPVFAQWSHGLTWGPTSGYLVGMFLSACWIGWCFDKVPRLSRGSDSNGNQAFVRGLLIALVLLVGSWLTLGCGVAVLTWFFPADQVLQMGFWPFLPGDFLKTLAVIMLVMRFKGQEQSPCEQG